jgi:hypothetical protein
MRYLGGKAAIAKPIASIVDAVALVHRSRLADVAPALEPRP